MNVVTKPPATYADTDVTTHTTAPATPVLRSSAPSALAPSIFAELVEFAAIAARSAFIPAAIPKTFCSRSSSAARSACTQCRPCRTSP
jgi:hypothetical protein